MLHALIAGLFVASSYAHTRGEGRQSQSHSRLVADNDAGYVTTDTATICYGDDECRGKEVCDMGTYTCREVTPSPVATSPPGCCYSDSYKANDKCNGATDQDRCLDMGCLFKETNDYTDCEMTTTSTTSTSTTSSPAGCCYGESAKEHEMCGNKDSETTCSRSNSCEWRVGEEADLCELIVEPTTTETPGCCYGEGEKESAMCGTKVGEVQCTRSNSCEWRVGKDEDGELCKWIDTQTTSTAEPGCCFGDTDKTWAMCNEKEGRSSCERSGKCEFRSGDNADCELTTTTSIPGCCYGDSYKANGKCLAAVSQSKCEDKGCRWKETDDAEDCVMTTSTSSSTTSTTIAPGCCYGDSYKSNGKCNGASTEARCGNGCNWMFTTDPTDCEMTTSTSTSTTSTTEAPGCCHGDTYKSNGKCNKATDQSRCEANSCRWMFTTDPRECEMTTTTSTTTTIAPGCCYGDTYKSNGKCNGATSEDRCESNGCRWMLTADPKDCEMTTTTTTTTTEEPGCCKGDSARSNPMCNARVTRTQCDKSSSCHFVANGDVEKDCVVDSTTIQPGCCYGNPDAAYSKKWMDTCTAFYNERDCLQMTDGEGAPRCQFEELIEGYDCSLLWPTTTTTTEEPGCCRGSSYKSHAKCVGASADQMGCERMDCEWVQTADPSECIMTTTSTTTTTETPGCCKGDSSKSNPLCNARDTKTQCEKSSSCHFIENGHVDVECQVESTTIESGCCYGNPDAAYNKKWMDTCVGYYTERECTKMSDSEGAMRCAWEPLGEYMDCAMLWPTTTTTTEEPGCCRGFSYKAQSKCVGLSDFTGCDRKGCEWVQTNDPSECILTTTTTTTTTTTMEPGCCAGDSVKTTERCNKMEGREKCERSSSCHFIANGELLEHCSFDTWTTSSEPGCCYGNPDAAYSKRWMESCTAFYTERDCLLLTNGDAENRCHWEALGEGYDCEQLWPTTTSTTVAPGCCRGFSYMAQAKCVGLADQMGCERKDCEWVETEDESECVLTTETPTTTTTTTEAPGCCKADSAKHQGLCDMKQTSSKCGRSSSCHWIESADPTACDIEETTTEIPGCCYGNPDAAYSKRWMESCKTFFTQRDCQMLENGDGVARCVFEELGDGYDCAQLWPTTSTTLEPGCCYGDTASSNAKCAEYDDDADLCDGRSQCVFRAGEDADCKFVPTTTTEEVGCCRGLERKNADMCIEMGIEKGHEMCDRSGKCEFIVTDDESECEWDTTTSEPWLNAQESESKYSRSYSGRSSKSNSAQQSMLFGGGESTTTTVGQAMQTQVSLSAVLMFVVAAFALYQAFQCVAKRNGGGYKQINAVDTSAVYQSV